MYCSNCGAFVSDNDRFCPACGQPNGAGAQMPNQFNNQFNMGRNIPDFRDFDVESAKGFWENMKNRMGIGEPDLNKGDAFEKGKSIVPECIEADEGEIPVKQYEVAKLRNRILFIPYMKAIGRMQVTNKRVIFRAPGRCIAGRTTLQHEFAIDEIAGVEAKREYVFNFWDCLLGILAWCVGAAAITALIGWLLSARFWYNNWNVKIVLQCFIALAAGVAGCIPFFTIKKKWLLKLLCLGGSCFPMFVMGIMASEYGDLRNSIGFSILGKPLIFLSALSLIIGLFALFLQSIRPNLVIVLKTKVASEAIDIRRKRKITPFGGEKEEHTGYSEVIPLDDAERCIREIDAVIKDIQTHGNLGIAKWKV